MCCRCGFASGSGVAVWRNSDRFRIRSGSGGSASTASTGEPGTGRGSAGKSGGEPAECASAVVCRATSRYIIGHALGSDASGWMIWSSSAAAAVCASTDAELSAHVIAETSLTGTPKQQLRGAPAAKRSRSAAQTACPGSFGLEATRGGRGASRQVVERLSVGRGAPILISWSRSRGVAHGWLDSLPSLAF